MTCQQNLTTFLLYGPRPSLYSVNIMPLQCKAYIPGHSWCFQYQVTLVALRSDLPIDHLFLDL